MKVIVHTINVVTAYQSNVIGSYENQNIPYTTTTTRPRMACKVADSRRPLSW